MKNFPDSKCAADSSLIVAYVVVEYFPPVGMCRICSRMTVFKSPARAGPPKISAIAAMGKTNLKLLF